MEELEELRNEIDSVDDEINVLFRKRMETVAKIAELKNSNGLPAEDISRENQIIAGLIEKYGDDPLLPYFVKLARTEMKLSKHLQSGIMENAGIIIRRGALEKASEYMDLDRKVLIVTDSGIPKKYVSCLKKQCRKPVVVTLPEGEESKNLDNYVTIESMMLRDGFGRGDCVVALGGGMIGDISGFAASTYMRGINFYNIPTTVLAQVDSSVGGKTAVDLEGSKNIVGTYYDAMTVIMDPDVLDTLDKRQFRNGLAEAVKTGVVLDPELFSIFENGDPHERIEDIIRLSVKAKSRVAFEDQHESGLRRVLNFGHTLGHAVESFEGLQTLLHGECVSIGMIPMCEPGCRQRVKDVLESLSLPTSWDGNCEDLSRVLLHDKKRYGGIFKSVIACDIGRYEIRDLSLADLMKRFKEAF